MIIDFHTHIFPDAIAAKTVAHLGALGGLTPRGNGSLSALLHDMETSGVDLSLNLPVVTDPRRVASINRFAHEINQTQSKVISFGGIHPDSDNVEKELDDIVALGLRGIKLHPDYQGVMIDDPRYIRLIREALARGLVIVIHAGLDVGFPNLVHCPPERAAKMLDAVSDAGDTGRIVLAHLGGYAMLDEVEVHLVGRNVMLDLAFVLDKTEREMMRSMIERHSAARILFGSDFPWSNPGGDLAILRSLGLPESDLALILEGNARRLLGDALAE